MYFRAVAVALIVVLWGMQLWLRSFFSGENNPRFKQALMSVWIAGLVFISAGIVWESYDLYRIWQGNPLSALFLPPHRSLAYFLGYVSWRYVFPWVISLLAAIIAYESARYLNRRVGQRFFEEEEPLIFALAVFLMGYPGFLFYILLFGCIALLLAFAHQALRLGRAPLYFLWLPTAVFAILITYGWIPEALLSSFNL